MPFLPFLRSKTPPRVKLLAVTHSIPLVFGLFKIVIRVDDGEFALGEGYAAEGVAVAEEAIEKDWKN